ncbi:MAG TPA: hypothetical protein VFE35_05330 [Candidatus Cybelea sp.]|nr:hypothetical protein [Candidatus Cybelea sp.]
MISLDFRFNDTNKVTQKELHKLFDVAVRLNTSQENALKYAIRVLSRRDLADVEWNILESYLLRSVTLSPNTIDYVAIALYEAAQRGVAVDEERISRFFAAIVKDALTFERDSELVWSLWLFKNLGIKVPSSITNLLGKMKSSTAALVALDLQNSGLLRGTLDTSNWVALLTTDDLYDANWLLVYEALVKGWLTAPTDIIGTDPSFAAMRNAGVHFYEQNAVQAAAPAPTVTIQAGAPPEAATRAEDAVPPVTALGAQPTGQEDHLVPTWILNTFTRRTQELEAEIGEDDDADIDDAGEEEESELAWYELY